MASNSAAVIDGAVGAANLNNANVIVANQINGPINQFGARAAGAENGNGGTKKITSPFEDIVIREPIKPGFHVYKATQKHGRGKTTPVAVKKISIFTEKDSREDDHLHNLTRIDQHRNIVQLFQSKIVHGSTCDELFIVMELCSQNLAEVFQNQLPSDQIWLFCEQFLEGMKHIHDNEIIHGDLKPENILVSLNGKLIKVADFGISKQLQKGKSKTKLTSPGTDGYRAPETEHCDVISKSADIYSSGIILYGFFTHGKHPFGTQPHEQLNNIMEDKPCDLSDLPKEMGLTRRSKLRNLIQNMLKFYPEDRPGIDEVIQLFTEAKNKKIPTPKEIPFKELFEWTGEFDSLEEKAGGKFGKVFFTKFQEETVAVKIPRPGVRQFKKEINILKSICHENIIGIRGWGEHKSIPFLVMEYLVKNLQQFVNEQKPDANQGLSSRITWEIAKQIAQVMSYLHNLDNPIAHCDLKPENITVDTRLCIPQIKLIGFGCSKHVGHEEEEEEEDGVDENRYGKHQQQSGTPNQNRSPPKLEDKAITTGDGGTKTKKQRPKQQSGTPSQNRSPPRLEDKVIATGDSGTNTEKQRRKQAVITANILARESDQYLNLFAGGFSIVPSSTIDYPFPWMPRKDLLMLDVRAFGLVILFMRTGKSLNSGKDTGKGIVLEDFNKRCLPERFFTTDLGQLFYKCCDRLDKRPTFDGVVAKYFDKTIQNPFGISKTGEFLQCGFLKDAGVFVAHSTVDDCENYKHGMPKNPVGYKREELLCIVDVKHSPHDEIPEEKHLKSKYEELSKKKFKDLREPEKESLENYPIIGLMEITTKHSGDEEGIEFRCKKTTHLHRVVMKEIWRSFSTYKKRWQRKVHPHYSNLFGIQVAVLTNEGPGKNPKFVLARRSNQPGEEYRGSYTIGMKTLCSVKDFWNSEQVAGLVPNAKEDQTYLSIVDAAARGLKEELGLRLNESDKNAIKLHTVCLDTDLHTWEMCGFIDLRSEEVSEENQLSFDKLNELFKSIPTTRIERILGIDFSLEEVADWMRDNEGMIRTFAKVTAVKTLQSYFGTASISEEFGKKYSAKNFPLMFE